VLPLPVAVLVPDAAVPEPVAEADAAVEEEDAADAALALCELEWLSVDSSRSWSRSRWPELLWAVSVAGVSLPAGAEPPSGDTTGWTTAAGVAEASELALAPSLDALLPALARR